MSTVLSKRRWQQQLPASSSAQPSPSFWRRHGWKLALGMVGLFVGLIVLDRAGVIQRRGPWSFGRSTEAGQAKRVSGVIDAVALGNESVCIKPDNGQQLCGAPQLPPGQAVPVRGSRVVAYYTSTPLQGRDAPRHLVWVAIYPGA